jgi:hypothetical protein
MEAFGAVDEVNVVEPIAVLVEKVEVIGWTAALRAVELARLAAMAWPVKVQVSLSFSRVSSAATRL